MLVAVAVGALAGAGFFIWMLKQVLAPSLNRAGTGLSGWLADRFAVLRSSGLRRVRRYQRSVAGYARHHALGFGTEPISVADVYVPLHREARDGQHEDLYEVIRASPRSVVTGEAGAGKSMLLKNSLLVWAGRPATRRGPLPVLVELRRLNGVDADQLDLVAQITAFLETNRFKDAAAFAPKALEEGRLSILFDGLDEVNADRLDRVVDLLRDFGRRYGGCQTVVTCRSSLYRGELAFGTVVQVAELDDASIRRLLSRWPGLGPDAQKRLFLALGTNGTLRRLARSPLLLSMMALLTADGITLPNSRAAFYEAAITHLVARDEVLRRGRSRFPDVTKFAVLRGLALLLQDRTGTGRDRLSISHSDAVDYVRSVAAAIDVDPKDAEPLLREVVDRTELLISTGGVAPRYLFRHLTFQEYLAAVELGADRHGLLERYDRDPNAWREAVILWCGEADLDAIPLIKDLMARDSADERVLALECAAAVTRVDMATVVDIVERVLPSLRVSRSEEREQAALAFGNAAAGNAQRNVLIRERLIKAARAAASTSSGSRKVRRWRSGLYRALALSGHESAAALLAELAVQDAEARTALRTMGDLAVPSLADRAGPQDLDAIDDLAAIGTPQAIEALLKLLDRTDNGGIQAASRLACLLGDGAFAEAVARRGAPMKKAPEYQWIWQPFSAGDQRMTDTVARIAEMIDGWFDGWPSGDPGRLDFRLVAALVIFSPRDQLPQLPEILQNRGSQRALRLAVAEVLRGLRLSSYLTRMIRTLRMEDQVRLLELLEDTYRRDMWSRVATAPRRKTFRLRAGRLRDDVLIDKLREAIAASNTPTASTSILTGPERARP